MSVTNNIQVWATGSSNITDVATYTADSTHLINGYAVSESPTSAIFNRMMHQSSLIASATAQCAVNGGKSVLDDTTSVADLATYIKLGMNTTTSVSISGLTNADRTLSSTEALADILVLAGTLTGAINLIIPASYSKRYVVVNNTAGNYAITIKQGTPGHTVNIRYNNSVEVYTDGANNVYPLSPFWRSLNPTEDTVLKLTGIYRYIDAATGSRINGWIANDLRMLGHDAGHQLIINWNNTVPSIDYIALVGGAYKVCIYQTADPGGIYGTSGTADNWYINVAVTVQQYSSDAIYA